MNPKETPIVSLEDLVSGITNHNKLMTAEARIQALEAVGNRLAFLMLNGSTAEIRVALSEWRGLVPIKKDDHNA